MASLLGRALLTSTRGPHFQPSSDGDVLHLSNRGTPAEEALLPNTLQAQFRSRSSDAVRWGLSGPHRTGAFRRGHLRYGGGVVPFPRGVLTLPADRTRESTTRRANAALAQQETVLGPRPAAEVRESLPPGLSRMYEG